MNNNKIIYIIISVFWLFLSYIIYMIADANQRNLYLDYESGFYEVYGAIFFLLSSILFFIVFFKKKNILLLFLAILTLVAFFEEISWGQHILNFATPENLKEINIQGEFNLHNLEFFEGMNKDKSEKTGLMKMINAARVFNLIWFTIFVLLPFLYKYNSKIKRQLEKINFPIIPVSIGVLFILNYLFAKIISINGITVNEIKEANIAFLYFIVSIWFAKN